MRTYPIREQTFPNWVFKLAEDIGIEPMRPLLVGCSLAKRPITTLAIFHIFLEEQTYKLKMFLQQILSPVFLFPSKPSKTQINLSFRIKQP